MKSFILLFLLLLFGNLIDAQSCKTITHNHKPLDERKALSDFGYDNFISDFSRYTLTKGFNYKTDECLKNFYFLKTNELVGKIFSEYIESNKTIDLKELYNTSLIDFKKYLSQFIEHEAQLRAGFQKVIQSSEINNNSKDISGNLFSPQAACTNMDFELGNLSGWTTTFQNGSWGGPNSAFASTPGPDAVVPVINRVFAGGFSACIDVLGTGDNLDWREISQTFLVNNANKDFVFYVAVIIDGGAHTCATNPFFNVAVTNTAGVTVPCSAVSLVGSGTGGAQCSSFNGWSTNGAYDFLRWTPVIVPLANYVGQNVTIKFRVTRCNGGGGHGARAYIEANCNPIALNATGNLICPGKSVNISAPNTPGYTYSWSGPSGFTASTFSITPNLGGAYTVTMSLTSNPSCNMVMDTVITAIPSPTPNFNYTVTPCAPTFFVPFESTSTSYSTDPISTYNWSWGDATANGSGTNPSHTYATAGVKNVTLSLQSAAGCTATTSQSLQLNVLPVANFIKKNICVGSSLTFTNTSTPIANILTQTWNFGDGSSIDTQFNTSHTYTTPGVYTVTLSVTSTDLCNAQSVQTLTVYPKPVLAASANTVCLNLTTAFTNSSTVATPYAITSWSWDFDNNGTTDNQAYAPTYGFNTVGTTNVELKGTTNVGCRDSILVPVVVNASQTANFTTVNACLNSAISINNSTSVNPPDFIVSYDWYFGANATPSVSTGYNPTPPVYSTSGVKTITLNITSNTTCTASLIQSVEIYAPPVANFSVNAVCQATATQFTDLSTSANSAVVHWQWDFDNNGVMDAIGFNSTPSFIYASSGTYTAGLVVTDANSCRDTTTGSLNVWGHSVPSFSTIPTCFNSVTTFSNSTVNNVNPNSGFMLSYDWNFGDGDSVNAIINPVHTYTTGLDGATFDVTLTATTSHLCVDKTVNTVTINPIPVPKISLNDACLNSIVGIANTSSIVSSASITAYSWNFGANATPPTSTVANPPSLTYNLSGIKIVTLTLTSNQTCTASITDTLEVYEQPIANFSTTAVCQAMPSTFTDMSASGGVITNWQWDFDSNGTVDVIGATSSTNYTYSSSGTFTASLIITDNFTCKDTIALPVTVYGNAIPNFMANAACFNTPTTFTNTTDETTNQNVGGILSHSWNLGDGSPLDPFINPTHTYTNNVNGATYDVTLTVTTNHNCVDSVVKTITINPLPIASFSTTNACLNTNVALVNNSAIAMPATIATYNWSFGADANPVSSSSVVPNVSYGLSGVKTITLNLISSQSCTAAITNTVVIYPQPTANFSVTSSCLALPSIFTDLSTPTGSITLEQWDFDVDGTIDATGSTASHVFPSSGTFTSSLIVTDSNTCQDTIQVALDVWGHSTPDFAADTVCFNAATTFTNLSTATNPNAGTILTYSWNFADASMLDASTNPVHIYTNSVNGATYNVTLTAVTNHNCTDSITKTVIVKPLPIPSFVTTNACLNTAVGLNNTSTITSPATITGQIWSFGSDASVVTSTLVNPSTVTYSLSGIKTVSLNLISSQSCTAAITNTIEIYPQPTANFSVTSVCQSTASVFTDLSTSTGSISLAQWDFDVNGTIDATGNLAANIYPASGTFSASLIATDYHTCKDTVQLSFDVWGHATPDFNSDIVCFNTVTSFTNLTSTTTNSNTGTIQSYSWNFADGSVLNSLTNPAHTYTTGQNGATYNVTLTATTSHNCMDSVVKAVVINPVPTGSFVANNACLNSNVGFINNSGIASPATIVSQAWSFGVGASIATSTLVTPTGVIYNTSGIKTITLSLTSNQTCTASVTNTVEVYPQPVANFSVTAVCQGLATVFSDLSTSTGSITFLQWDYTNDGFIDITGNSPTNIFPTSGTYTAALIATDSHTCKDTVALPYDIWGHAIPDFTPKSVCYGTVTSFSNTTDVTTNANVGGIQSYAWNFGDQTGIVTASNPNHIYTLGGNANASYNVTLTAMSSHNCVDSAVKVVSVYATPTASYNATEVCFGNVTVFSDVSSGNGNSVNTFEWDFLNDGTVDVTGIQNPNHTFSTYGNIPVSYTVSTSPIAGLVCKNSINKNILVNPIPIPDFVFTNKCVNAQPNTFNANTTVLALGTVTNNVWDFGDGNLGTGTSTVHAYFNSGTYNVSMTAYSDKGCFKDTTKQIEVYTKPVLSNIAYSKTCAGGAMTFTPTFVNNGTTINQYIWSFNQSLNVQNPSHVFANGGTYTINLISISNHACRDTFPKVIEVNYNPTPNFTAVQAGCGGTFCTDFTNQSSMPVTTEQIVDWKWVFGDGSEVHVPTNAYQSKCYTNTNNTQSATYDVMLVATTNKGCSDSITKNNFITVYPKPIAQFAVDPNPTDILSPTVAFTNQSQNYTKWWWNFGDSDHLDSVHVNPVHEYDGLYSAIYDAYLIVSNQYKCIDKIAVKVEMNPEFTFYIPNAFTPTNGDKLNDVFTGMGIGIVKYEMWVFDRWGTRVYYTDDIQHGWNGKYQGKDEVCKQDVYVWKVKLQDVFGKDHEYVGHVTLIK